MFRLNLKIVFRNLWKNKIYTLINVTGLSIGMASCLLIFIFIHYQLSFDQDFKNEDRIYRMVSNWKYNNFDDYSRGAPVPAAAAARNEINGFEKVGAIVSEYDVFIVKNEQGEETFKDEKRMFYAEADFFDIIQPEWISGAAKPGLNRPNTVVLSASMAHQLFGTTEVVGKNFAMGTTLLEVTGVFKDIPGNSSFPLNIVVSYANFYGKNQQSWDSVSSSMECYVLLGKGMTPALIQPSIDHFNDKYLKHAEGNQKILLQSLKNIHFNEQLGNFSNTIITKKEIYGLVIIGLFLMITACINFINLATAQAVNRSKEIGVRKVMGSMRKQLIVYFLTETLAITTIALLIACILAELLLPGMQNLFKARVTFSLFEHRIVFVFMAVLIVFVGFLAGFYPALVMSGFSPALAIKNKVKINSGNLNLRQILVVVQFSITIILIVATLVIMQQMDYVRKKPLGFNTDAIVMINAPADSLSKSKRNTFRERMLKIPGVHQLSYCAHAPLSAKSNTTSFEFNGQQNKDFEVRLFRVDENYFDLFGLKFITGRIFPKSDSISGYVVNETFLKKVSIHEPEKALGKVISQNGRTAAITGVIKDFNDLSLKEKISPIAIYSENRNLNMAAVKLDSKQLVQVMREIEQLWNSTFTDRVFYSQFVNKEIAGYYETEKLTGILFRLFVGVIIFISFIGLFGMVSFVATQRTREMAIRKVLGASDFQLIKMLNSSFLLMVFIANLAAWPLAYMFVSKWLSGFAYRIDLGIWPFLLAMVISMLITLVTVTLRSYKTARTNPVDALKYE